MAYPRIDTSPLFMPPRPSALSQGMGQVGDIMTALMQRRREQERQAILDQQKADELQFRKDQEERLTNRQTMMDEREDARLQAQETRQQEDRRLKGYEAVGKAKGPDRAFLAQLYGGELGQATPDYRANPNDPLSKNIDFVEEDDSPIGFSVSPEWEKRTANAENTQTLTMPGGRPIALPAEAPSDYARLRQTIALDPMQAVLARRLDESEAGGQTPEEAIKRLDDARRLAQQEALRKRGGGRGGGAGKPSDVRGDFTAFRGAATQWETASNVDKLTDAWDKFRELSSNVEDANRSGDTISRKSALYQAARYITGPGVLTPAEFENTVQRTGGSIGSLLTELEKRKSGDISDIEAAALEKFVTNAKNAVQRRAANAVKDYDRRFGSGLVSTNPTMKNERDAYRNSLLQRFEIEDPSAPKGNAVGTPKMLMKPADLDRLNRIKVR